MAQVTHSRAPAVGFRVKSGWAAAVLVGGSAESPQVVDCRRVDLCDPDVPETTQPYHAAMGTLQTDSAKITRLRKLVGKAAERSVAELLEYFRSQEHEPRSAGLVVGSDIEPEKITNPHIRAHALEGRLFRTVLVDALQGLGLSCSVILERNVYAEAGARLKSTEEELKRSLTKLGKSLPGPWRANEKLACLAAWMALEC